MSLLDQVRLTGWEGAGAPGGALQRPEPGAGSAGSGDVWAEARTLALTPAQVASARAARPYDLRTQPFPFSWRPGSPTPSDRPSGAQRRSAALRLRQVPQ
jgi:hypothetical protein